MSAPPDRPTSGRSPKPLGRKAYGSIGHLAGSRMGPTDSQVHEGQSAICTTKARPGDTIVVQEKLDGSCVAVANVDGDIIPLVRAGYPATSSPRVFHHHFARWALDRADAFAALLAPGERVVGEWIALAHGTRYLRVDQPFVAFDIMVDDRRALSLDVWERVAAVGLEHVPTLHRGGPLPLDEAIRLLGPGRYAPLPDDGPEGVVYRVERHGRVEFLAKWVNPAKIDGKYLDDISGGSHVWNWTRPPTEEEQALVAFDLVTFGNGFLRYLRDDDRYERVAPGDVTPKEEPWTYPRTSI